MVLPNQTPPTWYKLEHKHDINVWTEALSTPSAVPMTEAKATRKNVIVKMEFDENSQTIKFLEALILISYYINVSFLAFIFFYIFLRAHVMPQQQRLSSIKLLTLIPLNVALEPLSKQWNPRG